MLPRIRTFVAWTGAGLLAAPLAGCSSHETPSPVGDGASNPAPAAQVPQVNQQAAEAAVKARRAADVRAAAARAAAAKKAAAARAAAARAAAPAVSLSVAQLYAEYRKDRRAADKKYRGKIIQVDGFAEDPFYRDLLGRRQVIVGTPDANGLVLEQAACTLLDDDMPKVALLWRGQKLKIKGRCEGGQPLPQLVDGVLTEIGPSVPLLNVTADVLLAAYDKEGQKANAQYQNKPIVLTGVVDQIDPIGDNLYLRGKTPLDPAHRRIRCHYATRQESAIEKLHPGDRVQLKADCHGWWNLAHDIEIELVHVVE